MSCGLSMTEAAAFLKVSPDTARIWWEGGEKVPDGILSDLIDLFRYIDGAAARIYKRMMDEAQRTMEWPGDLELHIAADDDVARKLGFPCVAAHAAVSRRFLEMCQPEQIGGLFIIYDKSAPEFDPDQEL